ncbi:MAG TPA: ABC transporter ATP-binding protein [Hymenobacter sp.]|uniref:ABC transporter ATP-binding protein n=1 Tax=Hymenobacter sp. TaxID=1898978 RepID=UPI002D7FA838|nr:ABC transporter ATP-binding protein [Hymenobacter sp.]HET9503944.1 ABC transporter ATP-binding protein [Hymenobacter sp.]
MSDIAIKVEGLGKQYRLGEIGTGTISHDLNRWFARLRGKEDPFATVGETNDRTKKGSSDYVWSLKDVDFEVKKGEVLGIIGRNGAGKSTLLKVLSKVTAPTTGNIKVNGRIASLLEVGTGFHPELTGRENIFLNGAILGMTKTEIRSKFDEIVDFSGVERYIDTPVKRYSSGMYVRLAFAVAAFLEPEILIVDEVLAVGDAEFQKKCLGRMKDVSTNDGRTVLFVSHNMAAVKGLCNKGLVMKNGQVLLQSSVEDSVTLYYSLLSSSIDNESLKKANTHEIELYEISLKNYFGQPGAAKFDEPLIFVIKGKALKPLRDVTFNLNLTTFEHVSIFTARQLDNIQAVDLNGDFEVLVSVEHNLRAGAYILAIGIDAFAHNIYFNASACQVDVLEVGSKEYKYKNYGLIDTESTWQIKN